MCVGTVKDYDHMRKLAASVVVIIAGSPTTATPRSRGSSYQIIEVVPLHRLRR